MLANFLPPKRRTMTDSARPGAVLLSSPSPIGSRVLAVCVSIALAAIASAGVPARAAAQAPALTVVNHHEFPYEGPVSFRTGLPDGRYAAAGGNAEVRAGTGRAVVAIPAGGELVLRRASGPGTPDLNGPLTVRPANTGLALGWRGRTLGSLDLGLVVVAGDRGNTDDAVSAFPASGPAWSVDDAGALHTTLTSSGYKVYVTAEAFAGGWLDVRARLVPTGSVPARAYLALVRRLTIPGLSNGWQRFNGDLLDSASSPEVWSRDFWYDHGTDWVSWTSGGVSLAAINGFTPGPTYQVDSTWQEGSHFYVWERSRRVGNAVYLVSEVEGPNPHQATPRSKAVTAYAPVEAPDTVDLHWRLAVSEHPDSGWQTSQLNVYAGYRQASPVAGGEQLDLGVAAVQFGTSYLPYSTLGENFDFYRTPGENQETWWPFSAVEWKQWRAFEPRMLTDLHIQAAMGFTWVRLHHLEMLQQMDRADAMAFLDWFMAQARSLGLHVLIDSEGPTDWLAELARRYGDVARRFEIENEILIPGIPPAAPARWTAEYHAVKSASPDVQAYMTGAGNNGIFTRLRMLGVPFDRVGLHSYKHGPGYDRGTASIALASADYARSLGTAVTLSEFNWKNLTRFSPADRVAEYKRIFGAMLEPRAIPEFYQFQFHETIAVNPSARGGIRHYETIMLDRRPKPEAQVLMDLICRYSGADTPVRQLAIDIPETPLKGGKATVPFTLRNLTDHAMTVSLDPQAFGGLTPKLLSTARVTVAAHGQASGRVGLQLPGGAMVGTYHWFLRAQWSGAGGTRWGWGVAPFEGAPTFDAQPVLPERVSYPQGAAAIKHIDWTRPLIAVWGKDAPILDVEMAYLVANTLEAATGRPVQYLSTADVSDSLRRAATLILVGTPKTNPWLASADAAVRAAGAGQGVVQVSGRQVQLTGGTTKAAEAAAVDFVLRYWKHAKDAAIRVTGLEPGAALGHPAGTLTNHLP
jgi:hypothetical protein